MSKSEDHMNVGKLEKLERQAHDYALEESDEAEYRLCELKHLCAFVDDVTRSLPERQADELCAESLSATFGIVAELASGLERRAAQGLADRFDALDGTLHQLEHLCRFADQLTRALEGGDGSRLVQLRASSVFMMFGMVCDRLKRARTELNEIRAMTPVPAEAA